MRVFSVPVSAPFLRTVISALVDGRLLSLSADGFAVTVQGKGLLQCVRRLHKEPKRQARLQAELAGVPTGEPCVAWRQSGV